MSNKIRVLIADDQVISREGIRRILERERDMEIVSVVRTAPEVLPQVREKNPDVVLLDLKWHHDDHAMYNTISRLSREFPGTCIVVLTGHDDLIQGARAAGARWALTKEVSKDELVHFIRAAYASPDETVGPGELEKNKSTLKRRRGLKTGQQYAAYEEDVLLVLARALHPHLVNPRSQVRTINGGRMYDILFSNASVQGSISGVAKTLTDNPVDRRSDPTIGIITALPKEYVAVKAMLENQREYVASGYGAGRRYLLGEIPATDGGKHTLILSLADMGNNIAATRSTLLLVHFPTVESIIMVGIAGGVPHPEKPDEHVRLGDVVVSDQKGVVQYDFDKETIAETIPRHPPRPPSATLLEGVRLLKVAEIEGKRPWLRFIDHVTDQLGTTRPLEETDVLVDSTNPEVRIPHPKDPRRVKGQPQIFTGSIASANKLLKNPAKRDELRRRFGVKAIEMEGSGIADATWNHEVGYLVVRGICDYCDSNKGDNWQEYAAAVAAAYTRALLESIPCQFPDTGSTKKPHTPSQSDLSELLLPDYFPHPFWQRMSQLHDAAQIVFAVQNVNRLDVCHVAQVANCLTPELGRLGFLVSRIPAEKSLVQHTVDVFQTERKVILFLFDDDLERMLDLKEAKDDPTELIKQHYDAFIALAKRNQVFQS